MTDKQLMGTLITQCVQRALAETVAEVKAENHRAAAAHTRAMDALGTAMTNIATEVRRLREAMQEDQQDEWWRGDESDGL